MDEVETIELRASRAPVSARQLRATDNEFVPVAGSSPQPARQDEWRERAHMKRTGRRAAPEEMCFG